MPAMWLAAAMVMSAMVLAHLQEASGNAQEGGGRTRVVLLGTGTPVPDPARSGPALAVVVEDRAYLVDCGPGIVRQAAAAWEKGISALEPSGLKRVFITHLHSDHTLGLPDLIFTPWVIGRQQPLEVYGPEGISAMTRNLLEAYEADIRIRSGEQAAFDAAICRGIDTVMAKAAGFRGYKVNRGVESPDRYVLMIFWDTLENHTVDFRFRLDVSQLPRPFQIGAVGQADWIILAVRNQPLQLDSK